MEKYKALEEHPKEISVSTYWSNGNGMSYLREGLPLDHPEHLWNWFNREYPDLDPSVYGIKHPLYDRFENYTRDQLINKVAELEQELKNIAIYR